MVVLSMWKLFYTSQRALTCLVSLAPHFTHRCSDYCPLSQWRTPEEVKWPTYSHKSGKASTLIHISVSSRLLFPWHLGAQVSYLHQTPSDEVEKDQSSLKVFPASNTLSFIVSGIFFHWKEKKMKTEMVWNILHPPPLLLQWNLILFCDI